MVTITKKIFSRGGYAIPMRSKEHTGVFSNELSLHTALLIQMLAVTVRYTSINTQSQMLSATLGHASVFVFGYKSHVPFHIKDKGKEYYGYKSKTSGCKEKRYLRNIKTNISSIMTVLNGINKEEDVRFNRYIVLISSYIIIYI
jgi:hypothetical protein